MKFKKPLPSVETFEPRRMLDGSAELVADIADWSTDGPVIQHAWLDDTMFFANSDGKGDVELWKTDGTTERTLRVKDIKPGNLSSQPRSFVTAESRVFFIANRNELWTSTGTDSGTIRLLNLVGSSIDGAAALGNELYFEDEGTLWRSDGTLAGTTVVEQIVMPGEEIRDVKFDVFGVGNAEVYFTTTTGTTRDIWKSDGTDAGTHVVVEGIGLGAPSYVGGRIAYASYWNLPTLNLYHVQTGETTIIDNLYGELTTFVQFQSITFGDQLLVARHGRDGYASVWRIDSGTDTSHIGDFFWFRELATSEGILYFESFPNVWQTDGTVSGTTQIAGWKYDFLGVSDGELYLSSIDVGREDRRREVWHWDSGTFTKILFGSTHSGSFISSGAGKALLNTHDGLWLAAPAQLASERIHAPISTGNDGSGPNRIVSTDGFLFFMADVFDPECFEDFCFELWRSDGTSSGTQLVASASNLEIDDSLFPLQDRVVFRGCNSEGCNLYSTDGDETEQLSLGQDFTSVVPTDSLADGLYLTTASNVDGKTELWHTDGSLEGTRKIWEFDSDFVLQSLAVTKNTGIIFLALLEPRDLTDPSPPTDQLWAIDGGTSRNVGVAIALAARSRPWRVAGDRIFFREGESRSSQGGRQIWDLWTSDGTLDGTYQLATEVDHLGSYTNWSEVVGNKLIFLRDSTESHLWVSDGTLERTVPLRRHEAEGFDSGVTLLGATDEGVYFATSDQRLWVSDGTEQGTLVLQEDFGAHFEYWTPNYRTAVEDAIFLSSGQGGDLWRSDGTAEGTIRYEINPSGSSEPKYMTEHNGYVYFSANDGFHGAELWRVPIELPEPEPIPGDTNADGNVDFTDFLALSANFGRIDVDGFADGDFNDDDVVDFADFLILSEKFGAGAKRQNSEPN